MQAPTYDVDTDRFAKCIEVSKRVRWDIDKDVLRGREFDFLQIHWKEETTHTMMDEIEWPRIDKQLTAAERDTAVDEVIELVGDVDGILQAQCGADVEYFAKLCSRSFSEEEIEQIKAITLKAYRWQYIFSGVEHPRFQKLLEELTTENQGKRLNEALWQQFDKVDNRVKGDLVYILGQMAPIETTPLLESILNGEYEVEVKEAAREALEELS